MTLLRRIEDALRRVKDIEDGTTVIGLSKVSFSISWSGGDGTFKLGAAADNEVFSLAAVLVGIKGAIVVTEINCTEAFVDVGNPGVTSGPTGVSPQEWLDFLGASLPAEGFTLDNTGEWAGYASTIAQRNNINGASAPEVKFDTNAGPNVDQASAGKVTITFHYIKIPTPS